MNGSGSHKRRRLDDDEYSRGQHRRTNDSRRGRGHNQGSWARSDQAKINEIQEAERHRDFMAKEGHFVLEQKRKAAEIRVREGRAKPVDYLAVNLEFLDPVEDLINDDGEKKEPEYTEPPTIIQNLSSQQLQSLLKDIDDYLEYESKPRLRDYWTTMKVLCEHRKQSGTNGKAVRSVLTDIDKLLRPKTYDDLLKLEKQVRSKLDSDEPVDTDYWQQLVESLVYYKALAKVERLRISVLESKAQRVRSEHARAAKRATSDLATTQPSPIHYSETLDPASSLKIQPQQKSLPVIGEASFLSRIVEDRQRVLKVGAALVLHRDQSSPGSAPNRNTNTENKASMLYHQEASKGVEEDEEVFTGEEDVTSKTAAVNVPYHSRKPRYFNRVQMGYEWNKYNQTHYDQENPPPKVVQGYKFHIFYPDLIDPTKAPTYKITREGGRKRGETLAPAGEEDTCIIRFMSGPPYEDVAFRIVDREWDHSAKHERGFQSTFENGILTLHFAFKKIYYRK